MSSSPFTSPLCTDLYELTMAASYFDQGMDTEATFSLFLRRQHRRGYYVAAGLEPAIDWLENMSFKPDEIAYLGSTKLFKANFLAMFQVLKKYFKFIESTPKLNYFLTSVTLSQISHLYC